MGLVVPTQLPVQPAGLLLRQGGDIADPQSLEHQAEDPAAPLHPLEVGLADKVGQPVRVEPGGVGRTARSSKRAAAASSWSQVVMWRTFSAALTGGGTWRSLASGSPRRVRTCLKRVNKHAVDTPLRLLNS